MHTESELRGFLGWCEDRELDALTATRPHVELYVRWLQEVRRFRPSTVSRRMSVVTGFYRTCVIDGVLEHSPAEYVRRPTVPAESPSLGLTHLQFEAPLTAGRTSANRCDFTLVTMLGLLGLRIFEATGSNIDDLGEKHGHRVLRVRGKGGTVVPRLRRTHPHMLRAHAFLVCRCADVRLVAPETCRHKVRSLSRRSAMSRPATGTARSSVRGGRPQPAAVLVAVVGFPPTPWIFSAPRSAAEIAHPRTLPSEVPAEVKRRLGAYDQSVSWWAAELKRTA